MIYSKKNIIIMACAIMLLQSCRSAGETVPEKEPASGLAIAEAETEKEKDDPYWHAGTSTVTVKPGRARTIAVSYNHPETTEDGEVLEIDERKYFWTAVDPGVVSIRGSGAKCVIVGKKEGVTMVVVTNPDIQLPYAFRIVCTENEAAGKSFNRTKSESTEGRLVGGWSNLELAESFGD